MIARGLLASALALAPLNGLGAEIVSPAPDSVRITVYRLDGLQSSWDELDADEFSGEGLVMVSEWRTLDLPSGESTVVFRGVADAIVPQTAAVENLDGIVLESNYQYDLLSPGAILAHSHGERVRWVRTGPTGEVSEREATIRTGPNGVVLEVDGAFEALGCSGGAEKLVLARVPPQLASEPTLSMRVRTERAMRRMVRLSYLAAGINWKADYVARLDADSDTLDLTGWITLINHSGTMFANVPAEVVAGTVSFHEDETQPIVPDSPVVRDRCWPIRSFVEPGALREIAGPILQRVAGIEEIIVVTGMRMPEGDVLATQRELGDYKLYALPQPTTIAARQSKQVRFLERTAIKYERAYSYTLEDDLLYDDEHTPAPPDIVLRSLNTVRNGLGVPLPAGRVAVMAPDGTRSLLFAGGAEIQDVPLDKLLEFSPGKSIDVRIEPRVVEPKGRNADAAIEVRLANGSARAAVLEYRR